MATHPKALQRRLALNALTEEDKAELALVTRVEALRRQGATRLECARACGFTEQKMKDKMGNKTWGLLADFAKALAEGRQERAVKETVKSARERFLEFAPDAIDFYQECFRRNPLEEQEEKGIFVDPARAEWATERVSKGLGFTEPDVATRPTISIASAIIVGELAIVNSDDTKAKNAVIEVEATVVKDD